MMAQQLREDIHIEKHEVKTGMLGAQTHHRQPQLGPSYVPAGTGGSYFGQGQLIVVARHVALQELGDQVCPKKHCSRLGYTDARVEYPQQQGSRRVCYRPVLHKMRVQHDWEERADTSTISSASMRS